MPSNEGKGRIAMHDSVLVGCEKHRDNCEKCRAIQESQKTELSCQNCGNGLFFCRSKPCEYKLHCLNSECIKSKHKFVFSKKNNNQTSFAGSKISPEHGENIKHPNYNYSMKR
ncbi:hypothetical protein [Spiroplasma eriocheiris]|uniref:Uncharacterized protein n=1 Tax=Spiroplasma eriocheiris TaxID=315358 RepID=A0A0H3XHV0_9MOLU|nr:hypothetical protein [Spiroplasma eriocheiris]AHF57518.1 hypothetical protein SPE_0389 [Spiroplasma eriocheiris CCTCC M 207170]AKM53975.1 hypothetical protein SERIO_v1c03950 [Spiroplasma eriocheiris]